MSEPEPKRPYRIPAEEDYQAALEHVAMRFDSNGGPWAYYHKTALIEARQNQATQNLFVARASHARLIEPIEDEKLTPVDPSFKATHAFLAGLWTGAYINRELHQHVVLYDEIHQTIHNSLPHQMTASKAQYEENGRFLMTIGDEGLKLIGFEARETLARLGEDIVSDEFVRRYYALGAGAIVHAGHALYGQKFITMQMEYEIAQVGKEVDAYLKNISDTSSN